MDSPSKSFAIALAACSGSQLHFAGGSRSTAFNAYIPGKAKRLLLGVYQDGRVWTDCTSIGTEAAERLARTMSLFNVEIDTKKQWCFWKRDGERFYLSEPELERIAEAVANAARA